MNTKYMLVVAVALLATFGSFLSAEESTVDSVESAIYRDFSANWKIATDNTGMSQTISVISRPKAVSGFQNVCFYLRFEDVPIDRDDGVGIAEYLLRTSPQFLYAKKPEQVKCENRDANSFFHVFAESNGNFDYRLIKTAWDIESVDRMQLFSRYSRNYDSSFSKQCFEDTSESRITVRTVDSNFEMDHVDLLRIVATCERVDSTINVEILMSMEQHNSKGEMVVRELKAIYDEPPGMISN